MAKTDALIIFTFASFCIIAVAFTTLLPRANEPVLVLGNPFKSSDNTVSTIVNAGGLLVEHTAYSSAIISISDNPTFISKLYEKGAWLVISPRVLTGCFKSSKQT